MRLPYIAPEVRYGVKLAEYAQFFRDIALEVDSNPDYIFEFKHHPAVQFVMQDRDSTAQSRTEYFEALAYGDPGVLMTCPGPSLSGLVFRELGTQAQQDYFFTHIRNNHSRTFFGLTEPNAGSDAAALGCTLEKRSGRYYLNGEKGLFGNGAVGDMGVVFARTAPGPLGIRAVFLSPELMLSTHSWIKRTSVPMTGLRAAQIGYMRFEQCPIAIEHVLGSHKKPMEYGMMAIIKTFNRLRTGVGGLALGQAQAVLDFVYHNLTHDSNFPRQLYRNLFYQVSSARTLLIEAATIVENNPYDSYHISVAKIQATKTAERVVMSCIAHLPATILLENAWLAKCYRDCFAWEYMEGTSHMQLTNVYQRLQKRINQRQLHQEATSC